MFKVQHSCCEHPLEHGGQQEVQPQCTKEQLQNEIPYSQGSTILLWTSSGGQQEVHPQWSRLENVFICWMVHSSCCIYVTGWPAVDPLSLIQRTLINKTFITSKNSMFGLVCKSSESWGPCMQQEVQSHGSKVQFWKGFIIILLNSYCKHGGGYKEFHSNSVHVRLQTMFLWWPSQEHSGQQEGNSGHNGLATSFLCYLKNLFFRGEEIMKSLGENFQKKSIWLNLMPWLR